VYFAVAAHLRRGRYCFVNSYCRPLADGWLAKLDAALARPGVGQVGASGSWASMYSWASYSLGLPSVYAGLMPPRPVVREQLKAIGLERTGGRASRSNTVRVRLRSLPRIPRELTEFEPFPVAHLRSNAFMIEHELLRELRLPRVRDKMDTHVLESGVGSVTCQLGGLGLSSLVVDRDGGVFEPGEWHLSRTFWQGEQEGLLVADNQSECYAVGGFERRRVLSCLAWGLQADPGAGV
jgi:hypothetical protein